VTAIGDDGGRPGAVRVAAPTERPNPYSADLDLMSTTDVLRIIN
jgi:N-acetylmuramic acid 6-phosphate etherase